MIRLFSIYFFPGIAEDTHVSTASRNVDAIVVYIAIVKDGSRVSRLDLARDKMWEVYLLKSVPE